MLSAAASDVNTAAWWLSLGAGLVIAVVLVALLQLLLSAVKQVERNIVTLWSTATTVARNTSTTWMLRESAQIMDGLRDEVERHDRILSKGGRR